MSSFLPKAQRSLVVILEAEPQTSSHANLSIHNKDCQYGTSMSVSENFAVGVNRFTVETSIELLACLFNVRLVFVEVMNMCLFPQAYVPLRDLVNRYSI